MPGLSLNIVALLVGLLADFQDTACRAAYMLNYTNIIGNCVQLQIFTFSNMQLAFFETTIPTVIEL